MKLYKKQKTRKRKMKSSKYKEINHKSRKNKCRKNKKGGFHSCNDPNYSIYNTNFLSLFPYKPLQ